MALYSSDIVRTGGFTAFTHAIQDTHLIDIFKPEGGMV